MATAHTATRERRPASPLGLRREAIVGPDLTVRGYHLHHQCAGGGSAPARVLLSAFADIGLHAASGGRPAFVDVDAAFVTGASGIPFAPGTVVLQLDGEVPAAPEALVALGRLAADGHMLAVRVERLDRADPELLAIASVAKLPIGGRASDGIGPLARGLAAHDLLVIAEGVDDQDTFAWCRDQPIDLFQGSFFCRPVPVPGRAGAPAGLATAATLARADATFEEIEEAVSGEPRLALQLLRLVNSAAIPTHRRIASVREALMVLGARAVRQWGILLVLSELAVSCDELVVVALARGRAVQSLATLSGLPPDPAFATGLFSVADALLGTPLAEALQGLPLSSEIAEALLEGAGSLGALLAAVRAYERGELTPPAGLNDHDLLACCTHALIWAQERVASAGRGMTEDQP